MDESTIIEDLKQHEGFRKRAYRDTEGLLTIGYGTLIEDGITPVEAQLIASHVLQSGIDERVGEILLRHRLMKIAGELLAERPKVNEFPLTVQRAIINMAYNLGVPRLLYFRKMWAALEEGDWTTAADEAVDSKWYTQVGVRGQQVVGWIREAA